MIEVITKDITTVTCGVVAHGTNCDPRGIMGSGVALAVKKKWPIVYSRHQLYVTEGARVFGTADMIDVNIVFENELIVANCYTQLSFGRTGRRYADLVAIETSLSEVYTAAGVYNLDVYLPEIGGGLGGLDFPTEVFPIIHQLSTHYHINTHICIIDQMSRDYCTDCDS